MNQPASCPDPNLTGETSETGVESGKLADSESSRSSNPALRKVATMRWSVAVASIIITIVILNGLGASARPLIDTIGNFQWQLVSLTFIAAIYQFVKRRRRWGLVLMLLAVVPAWGLLRFYVPARQPEGGSQVISLLTMNVLDKNTNYQAAIDLIHRVDADIVSLIEYTDSWDSHIPGEMDAWPYRLGPALGNVIYSKFPIVENENQKLAFDPTWLSPAIGGEIWIGDERVYLLLVHTTSPTSRDRLVRRDTQIQSLASSVEYRQKNMHVVAVGDFNATSHCHSLDFLMKSGGLRDSRRGFGIQNSWPTWCWPLNICIDHVLVTEHTRVHERRTERSIGSDHLPVYVELSFDRHPRRWPENAKQAHRRESKNSIRKGLSPGDAG